MPSSFALDKIKEAEKLYKQAEKIVKTKPQNALSLLDKAITLNPLNPQYYYLRGFYTDGAYTFTDAKDPDNVSVARFTFYPDRKNELVSNEGFATQVYKSLRTDPTMTLTSDVISDKLISVDAAYFDFIQKVGDTTFIGRSYYVVWDYYAFSLTSVAPDQAHFDAAMKDFINKTQ